MEDIYKFISIDDYNKKMGVETQHPLVTVIDFSKSEHHGCFPAGHSFAFYTVFLKEQHCGDMKYGRNYYDYQDGTLVFLAPDQIVRIENRKPHQPKGWALMFHPDLIRGTSLGKSIKDYTFFSYEIFEALHMSDDEKKVILECFKNIQEELSHSIDKHSKKLIVSNIELFLNYCTRFYDRQFITRNHVNSDILSRFENLLNNYVKSEMPTTEVFSSVRY